MKNSKLKEKIFTVGSDEEFNSLALEIFSYQYSENRVYRTYCDTLQRGPDSVKSVESIPFLPISLFRSHMVVSGKKSPEMAFKSSGTTGMVPGIHHIIDLSLYERSFTECFRLFYGDPSEVVIVALLPSYIERGESSLVYMVDRLTAMSPGGDGGFYLNDFERLIEDIYRYRTEAKRVLLLGVTFALIELAENYSADLSDVIVMETGGMKGRGREMTREEVHGILSEKLGCDVIHSEYGMTELLSQAYSDGKGLFRTAPWMRVIIRDMYDPFAFLPHGSGGGVNIIDLANLNSCSFIETADLGIVHPDGAFEISGRFDNSDIRGCNLMVV